MRKSRTSHVTPTERLAKFINNNPPVSLLDDGERISWLGQVSELLATAGFTTEADRAQSEIARLTERQINEVSLAGGRS